MTGNVNRFLYKPKSYANIELYKCLENIPSTPLIHTPAVLFSEKERSLRYNGR